MSNGSQGDDGKVDDDVIKGPSEASVSGKKM
jgi:hypothetical protein